MQRNSTFFTTLNRPPYSPSSSDKKPAETAPEFPIAALHTAAAALCLVPQSHWNIETHKFNITSYDGSGVTRGPEEDQKTRMSADKAFKKELYHYLRWALSAGAPGPGIPETMEILGRPETVRRLQEAKELTTTAEKPDDRSWMGSLAR